MDGKVFEDLVGLPEVAHIEVFCPLLSCNSGFGGINASIYIEV